MRYIPCMDLDTAGTFVRAVSRALVDSTETEQLLIGEEISSVGRMRALIPILEACDEGRAILAERPTLNSTTVDFKALGELPIGTVGRSYADHLQRCGLDPDALTVPVTRGASELENYLLMRVRQTHDIWHTVLGLGANGHEEVLVHTFQWPQLRMPYSALVVAFGTLKHILGEARWSVLRHTLHDAWAAGRDARPLLPVYWERHWSESMVALRARLGVRHAKLWRGLPAAA